MIKTKYISNNYGRKVIYPHGDAPIKRCGVLAVSLGCKSRILVALKVAEHSLQVAMPNSP